MTVPHAPAQLAGLARHLRGRLILPGEQDWDTARRPWNRRVDQRPAAIVEPEGAGDMAATVAVAARHGLRVTAQATGHGASDALEDTIVLRTGRLRDITLDPARDRVLVGAGVRCADLMAAIGPHGLAASVGSAADAGVAGYAMFGGVGVLGRTFGFLAHQILAADVVTADGSRLRCDTAAHPDLLWALRGGGGGFALVARLDLRLARVPALFGGQIVWPLDAAPAVFGAWRSWTAGLPPEMTSSVSVIQVPPLPEVPEMLRGRRVTAVTACYAGPADEGAHLLQPLTGAAEPLFSGCRPLAPADLATLHDTPATPTPSRIRSELLTSLPDAAIGEFLRHAGQHPDSPLILAEIRHLGGTYAHLVPEPKARQPGDPPSGQADGRGPISHTGAQYLLELVGHAANPEADAAIRGCQQNVAAALAPWTTGTTLPSFADPGTDTARLAFPAAVRRRLAAVKRRYDPGDVLLTSFPYHLNAAGSEEVKA